MKKMKLLPIIGLILFAAANCFNSVLLIPFPPGPSDRLDEFKLYEDGRKGGCLGLGGIEPVKYLLIPIQGAIGPERSMQRGGTSPADIKKILEYAERDSSIR